MKKIGILTGGGDAPGLNAVIRAAVKTAINQYDREGVLLRMPVSHAEGNYFAPPDVLAELEAEGRVAFRYVNPRGERAPTAGGDHLGRGQPRQSFRPYDYSRWPGSGRRCV